MHYRTLCFLALTALGGCATQRDPMKVSDFEICKYTMNGGNNAMVAQREATRRGLDCQAHYAAIAQKEAAEAAQTAATLQIMRALQPAPAPVVVTPPAQPVNCTTKMVGNRLQTYCY